MFYYILKNSIDNIHKIFTVFLLIMALTGCGFHLRGNYSFHSSMQEIYITPDDQLEPLQKVVRRMLQRNKVVVNAYQENTMAPSLPILHLSAPVFAEQILAITADGQNQRVKMTMTFNYQVTLDNKFLRKDSVIMVSRDLSINPTTPLASESERRPIKDELLKEGANQLLRQLATISIQKSNNVQSKPN